MNNIQKQNGFTLVEVLVSVSIFAIVMLVATGAVFSIVEANKKSHTLKSVMTNLNFALESMARDIRVGTNFSCGGGGDCSTTPGSVFSYKANRSLIGGAQKDNIEYKLVNDGGVQRLQKRVYGDGSGYELPITAKEINIESLKFYVIGSGQSPQDSIQPKVLISIQGYAGSGNARSDFNIQTTVSQRAIDS